MIDGNIGDMIETAIYSQWIPRKGHIAYANWKMGRSQGEVDLVGINDALQKPYWAVEIKWSDRFFDKPSELSSLQFLWRRIICHRLWLLPSVREEQRIWILERFISSLLPAMHIR